jgi:hypothetical protein
MHQLTLACTALVRYKVISKLQEVVSIRTALNMLAERFEAL